MDIHSRYTPRSTSQAAATATEQNDGSSSTQVDKVDTNLSSVTRNEGQIGETTTFVPAPGLTPSPSYHSTLISEIPTEQTYGTQVTVDELSENKAQLAYPPSDGTDASHLPPLVPVRQSQPIATTSRSPPVAQNTSTKVSRAPTPASSAAPQGHQLPSQYSRESYRAQIPKTHSFRTSVSTPSPRTSGESRNPDTSLSLAPQQYISPLQSVVTPQPHSLGPTQPFIAQSATSQSYNIPNVPTSQTHQQFVPQSAQTRLPSAQDQSTDFPRYNSIAQTTSSQKFRKANVFVAIDPFRVSRRNEKVDEPSDGLTFDDIPTAGTSRAGTPQQFIPESTPSPSQFYYNSIPDAPTPQAQSIHTGTPQPSQMSGPYKGVGETYRAPGNPIGYNPTPPPVQSQAPVPVHDEEEEHPSIYIVAATPPASLASPSSSQDMSFTQHEPQTEGSQYQYPISFFRYPHSLANSEIDWHKAAVGFLFVIVPEQLYLLFLLRLPSLYFSRVARIFEEAEMSLPEIKKMVLEMASQRLTHEFDIEMAFESAYKRLASTWEYFIDSVMREWKTFNIISVLLLSAILAILQIESAADDPLTRFTALFSLMCALISLLFGCMYIIRFGSMRKSYKAAEWALEAKNSKMPIWWNVWVLLAMPAIWLTWSIILYTACIMSFVWRSGGTSTAPRGLSDTGFLAIRIAMTVVLGIGVLYGFLIVTTFQRYGAVMDKAWKQRIDNWIQDELPYQPSFGANGRHPRHTSSPLTYVRSHHMGSPHTI